jgi:hypothetical protein
MMRSMRPLVTGAFVLGLVVLVGAGTLVPAAQAPVAPPPSGEPWPDAKTLQDRRRSAQNRLLFASAEPLAFTLEADFRTVQGDRDPKSTKTFPATITFANDDGSSVSIPLQVRTRGHSRRLRQTCDFAPLRLEFPKDGTRKTVFDGHGPIKLGTHCRSVNEFEQYVLREYTAYRIYNLLTPYSFRARLAKATYVDARNKKPITTRYAMFIEDDDDVAKRMEGRITERMGLIFRHVDAETLTIMTLFEYMIGNTDMSINKQHNVRIVEKPDNTFYPVPYDFDYSGLVDAAYAIPSPDLAKESGIGTVRERLYRGPCKTPAELEPFFERMRNVKADVMALYDSLFDMSAGYKRSAKSYIEQFYRTLERPGDVRRALIDPCVKAGM